MNVQKVAGVVFFSAIAVLGFVMLFNSTFSQSTSDLGITGLLKLPGWALALLATLFSVGALTAIVISPPPESQEPATPPTGRSRWPGLVGIAIGLAILIVGISVMIMGVSASNSAAAGAGVLAATFCALPSYVGAKRLLATHRP